MNSERKKISTHHLLKLQKSGWQSWSSPKNTWLKFPLFNFFPKGKNKWTISSRKQDATLKKPAYGWCSWYCHGANITQKKILDQASWIIKNKVSHHLPLEYILIDDGWTIWGDWLHEDQKKFPKGLSHIVKATNEHGLKTGIWIAPFLVDPKSRIALRHPDWLVRRGGNPVEGLRLTPWDKHLPHKKWILDIKNQEVKKYLNNSIKYLVEECGFDLLKLDFLYGIHADPSLSESKKDKFLRQFLLDIKKKYPHVYTIACGCPLIPAVGVVDSMRIGPDTSLGPIHKFFSLPFFSRWYLDKHVLPTVLGKIWTKKFWNVDPDAYICHPSSGYSDRQLKRFRKIIRVGRGNLFLGDDLTRLSDSRIKKHIHPLFNEK